MDDYSEDHSIVLKDVLEGVRWNLLSNITSWRYFCNKNFRISITERLYLQNLSQDIKHDCYYSPRLALGIDKVDLINEVLGEKGEVDTLSDSIIFNYGLLGAGERYGTVRDGRVSREVTKERISKLFYELIDLFENECNKITNAYRNDRISKFKYEIEMRIYDYYSIFFDDNESNEPYKLNIYKMHIINSGNCLKCDLKKSIFCKYCICLVNRNLFYAEKIDSIVINEGDLAVFNIQSRNNWSKSGAFEVSLVRVEKGKVVYKGVNEVNKRYKEALNSKIEITNNLTMNSLMTLIN